MKTFQERFCAEHRCPSDQFLPKVFRHCLQRRAGVVALLLGVRSDFFSTDRQLIASVASATTMAQVHEEVRDYQMTLRRTGWFHRVARMRVSARRLLVLAESLHLGREAAPAAAASGNDSRTASSRSG